MFHVEQFMIPNVKQLLPKLRRNVITSAISLLVPPGQNVSRGTNTPSQFLVKHPQDNSETLTTSVFQFPLRPTQYSYQI